MYLKLFFILFIGIFLNTSTLLAVPDGEGNDIRLLETGGEFRIQDSGGTTQVSFADNGDSLWVNDALIDLSAITHDDNSAQGLKLPQADTLTDIGDGSEGYIAWDTNDDELQVFDGTNWVSGGFMPDLQDVYDNDADGGDAIIALTTDDDSIEIDNPVASGTDSAFAFLIDQNATGNVTALQIETESFNNPALDITRSGFGDDITITNTDAGANGVDIEIFHDSASPAAADRIAEWNYVGRDSGGNQNTYASVSFRIDDPTDTSEDGIIVFSTEKGAIFQESLRIDTNGLIGIDQPSPTAKLDVNVDNFENIQAVFIDQNDIDEVALNIDSEGETGDAVQVDGVELTTGDALQITVDNTMTTGKAIRVLGGAAGATEVFNINEDGDTAWADEAHVDLSAVLHDDTGVQGIQLPQIGAAPSDPTTGEGYLGWDQTNDNLEVNDGSTWLTVPSIHVGASQPAACSAGPPDMTGKLWFDTDTGILYTCDTTRNKWLSTHDIVIWGDESGTCTDGGDTNSNANCNVDWGNGLGPDGNTSVGFYLPYDATVVGYGFSADNDQCTGAGGTFDVEVRGTGSNTNDNAYTGGSSTLVDVDTALNGQAHNSNASDVDLAGDQYILWGVDNNCGSNFDDFMVVLYLRWRSS